MCGIVAIHGGGCRRMRERVQAALQAMRHRGPDGANTWHSPDGRLGLGSARLAVMGEKSALQPISNEAGTIRAVVNGEFYGFERLRDDLEGRGHVFATGTDSEVLVHLYEDLGPDCLRLLRGEFAFVLWDGVEGRLFAARDRFGIKPLHLARLGGERLFASEAKALFAAGVPAGWDLDALGHCLVHQYSRSRETLFAGVRQLAPAHAMVIDHRGEREFRYWHPSFETRPVGAEEILAALDDAVALRMRCDVPVACTVSGGVDSSAVAALASRHGTVGRFTVAFEGEGYDESELLATSACMVRVTRRDLALELPAAVVQCEGLAINGQLVGKFMLSRAIRDAGFKVTLSGEGADEGFLGYAHLQHDAGYAPDFGAQRGVMLPAAGETLAWRPGRWLPTFFRAKLTTGQHFLPLLKVPLDAAGIAEGTLAEYDEELLGADLPRRGAWLWTRLALAGYILRTLGDGAEMAHSVEARLPFLDHVLFEIAAQAPTESLVDGMQSKKLLREALRGLLPEEVRTRPKHPFLAPPLLPGAEEEVKNFVEDTLRSAACRDLPLLDHSAVLHWSAAACENPRLDPVLMLLLTATLLNQAYRLS